MKTIFLNLFSNAALLNFVYPGGPLDLLIQKAGGKYRIVVLLNAQLMDYVDRFKGVSNLEFVAIPKRETFTFLQKAFRFFYSYLIFTGTTRLLATFGARADAPPAGGNRHLAFIKSFIAHTFGKIPAMKTVVVPWLYQYFFSDRPYKALFEKYQPSLLYAANIAFYPDTDLILEARRHGVISVGMPVNWDHLNKYFIPMRTDYLLIQNEPMHKEAVELQAYSWEDVIPVGFSQFDSYFQPEKHIQNRKEFFEYFGIKDIRTKIILFISGSVYSPDEGDVLEEIARWIKENRFEGPVTLMVRPYVGKRSIAKDKEKYQALEEDPNVVFNWRQDNNNLEAKNNYMGMYFYADVIISVFSTTAIEAAIFDKPTITVGFDGFQKRPYHQSLARLEELSHFRHVLDTGSVLVARSFDELYKMLEEYLKSPEKDADKRKDLMKKMCYGADGHASERIVDALLAKLS